MRKRFVTKLTLAILAVFMLLLLFAPGQKPAHAEQSPYLYLSDIPYVTEQSKVGWSTILYDQVYGGGKISLKVNGVATTFEKGIWAHASSVVVYDISAYSAAYDYFTCYYGIATSANYNPDGVKFFIYTSADGTDWTLRTEENPPTKDRDMNAGQAEISIAGCNYLKLVIDQNTSNGNDNSVWADAKLIKYDESIKRVSDLDAEITAEYASKGTTITGNPDYELLLLQREFVNNAGYAALQSFALESSENKTFINMLMSNPELLRMYINGGEPRGTYTESLKVFKNLYNTYSADLTDANHGTLYKKMIVTLSLTHASQVRFWIKDYVKDNAGNGTYNTDPNSPNISDSAKRYQIFKEQFLAGKLESYFESLEVEELRYILGSDIGDDEIKWVRDFTAQKGNTNPYGYLKYTTTISYWADKYYSDENRSSWNSKYNLEAYGVPYLKNYPHLWIIFEEGGVCWQISNTGQNIYSAYGRPSTTVGQPGHVAYLLYNVDAATGRHYWNIWNDVSGWNRTNDAGYNNIKSYYSIRWLNGWGNGAWSSNYEGTYIILAQDCLDRFEGYELCEELLILADSFTAFADKDAIIRKALEAQDINLDAWYELVNLYVNESSVTEDRLVSLAEALTAKLKYYPLPMHDLLALINKKVSSAGAQTRMTMLEANALKEIAALKTSSVILQPGVASSTANMLLGNINTSVATFSFDGEKANTLSLGLNYADSHVTWDYSLDGGSTWTQVDDGLSVVLSSDEINSITVNNDIKVHIIGTSYAEDNIYTIDITTKAAPVIADAAHTTGLYGNDDENRIINADNYMEYSLDGGSTWARFAAGAPDLTGDKTVLVRYFASGTCKTSDSVKFTFTKDAVNPERKYISISHLSIAGYSTDAPGNGQAVANCIDGNIYSIWHSNRSGQDTQKYVIIKLDAEKYISGLRYQPNLGNSANGRILTCSIYTSLDGVNYKLVNTANWANSNEAKTASFEGGFANYVKIVGTSTVGSYITAGQFSLYENTLASIPPTGTVSYSTEAETHEPVTATLSIAEDVTVVNNNGEKTYAFDKNGTFVFEIESKYGIKGQVTAQVGWIKPYIDVTYSTEQPTSENVTANISCLNAYTFKDGTVTQHEFTENGTYTFSYELNEIEGTHTAVAMVDWIDKTAPVGTVYYDVIEETNTDVTATLVCSEEVELLNVDTEAYVFNENGTFTFEFKDKAGNTGSAAAAVTWINKTWPAAEIVYSVGTSTAGPVIATIKSDENIIILNNNGEPDHSFSENGSFTFEYKNHAGTCATVTAEVDWITAAEEEQEDEQEDEESGKSGEDTKPEEDKKPGKDESNKSDGEKKTADKGTSSDKTDGNHAAEQHYEATVNLLQADPLAQTFAVAAADAEKAAAKNTAKEPSKDSPEDSLKDSDNESDDVDSILSEGAETEIAAKKSPVLWIVIGVVVAAGIVIAIVAAASRKKKES